MKWLYYFGILFLLFVFIYFLRKNSENAKKEAENEWVNLRG